MSLDSTDSQSNSILYDLVFPKVLNIVEKYRDTCYNDNNDILLKLEIENIRKLIVELDVFSESDINVVLKESICDVCENVFNKHFNSVLD